MKYVSGLKNQKGFTLLEVIVTIIMAGVLGSMLFSYVGTAVVRSGEPIGRLRDSLALNQVMENIANDYDTNQDIEALKNSIGNEDTDPNNDYTTDDTNYPTYHVEENRYIKFDSGVEQNDSDSPCEILKVTISYNAGEKFTSLFTGSVDCP